MSISYNKTTRPKTLSNQGERAASSASRQAVSSGVGLEQVPTATLEIIRQLIPALQGQRGGEPFLVSILALAEVTQFALPGQDVSTDTAMIRVPTIRELAKQIHWGYDAANKYVMVLCALGLLYTRRHQDATELYVPLSPQAQPQPDLLDQFPKRRGKVNSFVRQIKRRLVLLSQSPAEPTSLLSQSPVQPSASSSQAEPIASSSPSSVAQQGRGLLQDIDRILHDELGDGEEPRRIMLHIEVAVYQHLLGWQADQDRADDGNRLVSDEGIVVSHG